MDRRQTKAPFGVHPADLEIRITTPWVSGKPSLEFVLHSPSGAAGFYQESVTGSPVTSPEEFYKKLVIQLEKLHRGKDVEDYSMTHSEIFKELTSIGNDLYEMLFPREMRHIYRSVRSKVTTLIVTSDEPWIPWEILRPYEFEDDDFFCMKFQMSRWLTGETALAPEKRIQRLLCIETGQDDNLRNASVESRYLKSLVDRTRHLEGSFPPRVLYRDVIRMMDEETFDLVHVVGHGLHDDARPTESKIELSDRPLRARHLSPIAQKRLRERRPVVFFNTCQSARLEMSLKDPDGWAARWVKRCGCSAFLAPFLTVRDERACLFAQVFYGELYRGRTLGQAVLLARQKLREENAGEMAWLAYSLYGHPNARIVFGEEQHFSDISQPPAAMAPVPPPKLETYRPVSSGQDRSPSVRKRLKRQPFLYSALGVTLLLMIYSLVALLPSLRESTTDPPGFEEHPESKPEKNAEEPSLSDAGTEEHKEIRSTPPPDLPPPPPVARQKTEVASKPPAEVVPLKPLVQGKLGIVVLDRKTRKPDFDVADAIEAVLSSEVEGIFSLVPRPDSVEIVEPWLSGDYSSIPDNGQVPWGAEYLLLATVDRKDLPQTSSHIKSLSMNLSVHLVATASRSRLVRSTKNQTGAGSPFDAALRQAVERCLTDVTSHFKGE